MMLTLKHSLLIAGLLGAPVVQAKPVWISIGDDGYRLLQQVAPQALSHEQRQLRNDSGAAAQERSLRPQQEKVHLLQIDEALLPSLSEAVHDKLRHCGGYMVHRSLSDARSSLDNMARQGVASPGVAPSYAINDQAKIAPLLPQMQESNLLSTMQALSNYQNRFYTTSHGVAASGWVARYWKQLAGSRNDITVEQVSHAGYPQKSVILTIKGSDNAAETVVLGAHLDSTIGNTTENSRAPGADDDASGVASLSEVIRVLANSNYKPRRTLKFMAYAAEEVGLRGSADIAARYKQKRIKVVGALQLDMTNYQGNSEDILIYTDYTNAAQNDFLARLIRTYQPTLKLGYDRCGYGCSDHASWYQQGFAASLPFESRFSNYNPNIHTSNDTLANMGNQARHALKFSKLALTYAVELGSDGASSR